MENGLSNSSKWSLEISLRSPKRNLKKNLATANTSFNDTFQNYTAKQQLRHNEDNTSGDCALITSGEGQEMRSCASHNILPRLRKAQEYSRSRNSAKTHHI